MRFIIIHKTNARWEAGEIPDRTLIADVGALIGELKREGILRAGEGLRASSLGARLTFSGGGATVTAGPFPGETELTAGFDIIRAETLDEAVRWASEVGRALGDGQLDVRPVTEPWDIGLLPKPEGVGARRFMVQRKATAETESGRAVAPEKRRALERLRERAAESHLTAEEMRPSSRGRRCKNTAGGVAFTDGPFTESKELIAGYVIIEVGSLEEASRWCDRYIRTVRAEEADVLELEEPLRTAPDRPAPP
jgi:hypothetical protein